MVYTYKASFNITEVSILSKLYLFILHDYENKQRLSSITGLIHSFS